MQSAAPYSNVNIPEVMTRNSAARDIVAGFASAAPALSVMWRHIETALADSRDLASEVARLSDELSAARLGRANALAAIRATLGAHSDGEADPLSYLRDELQAAQNSPAAGGRGNRG
jgi:hypothetical protein